MSQDIIEVKQELIKLTLYHLLNKAILLTVILLLCLLVTLWYGVLLLFTEANRNTPEGVNASLLKSSDSTFKTNHCIDS